MANEPTITQHGDWHLVRLGNWEVSIAPDGLLMLPRHLHPREVPEFCAAITAAAEKATEVVSGNEEAAAAAVPAKPTPRGRRQAMVASGDLPPGAQRRNIVARTETGRGAIGRNRPRDLRERRVPQPPGPPGVTNGGR